jgi:DNA invertase Pin-like site-specific DNA recombinase
MEAVDPRKEARKSADIGGRMEDGQPRRAPVGPRVRIQAIALFLILTADGVGIQLIGGPLWLTCLYVALGVAVAAGRIRLAARAHTPAIGPSEEQAASPVPAVAPPQADERRVVGYACVPREDLNGELALHSAAIRAWSDDHGAALIRIMHDIECAGDNGARPALCGLLERIAAGEADTLVVARLGHLSSTVASLPPLLRWFDARERTLVAIDLRIDTATEAGRLAAVALIGVGGWEHDRLSARTRRGLEAARARGATNGRAAVGDVPELRDRITGMREAGMTLQAIADELNREGVPTLRGGAMWRPSSVQRATGYRRPPSQRASVTLPGSDSEHDRPATPA